MKHIDDYIQPISSSSISQRVIDQLTKALISGQLKPGDKIPTEVELAESFGVARNSIREGIKILEAFGIVEIRRAEGTFIRNGLSQSMINPLLYGIILNQGDSYEILKEFRKYIEIAIIKLCINKYTVDDLKEITAAYDHLVFCATVHQPDLKTVVKADDEFHKVIAESTHNPLMETINSLVRTLTAAKRFETNSQVLKVNPEYFINSHKAIYTAIVHRNDSNLEQIVPDKYFVDIEQL
ncbi:FadR/GntR family transcriptional regulator [Sporomusa aerivorans]|uniref:FadR/GntR family transcriptional regulator n=1 Tax=Sporomusa aerivorans TaxID=204936 RepID=UPI00352ADD94